MVTDFPIQAILDHLVERIVEIMPVTAAGVTLISPGVEPRYIAASNDAALRFEKLQSELARGHAWWRTRPAKPSRYLTSPKKPVPDFVARACGAGLAAVFTFPLRLR